MRARVPDDAIWPSPIALTMSAMVVVYRWPGLLDLANCTRAPGLMVWNRTGRRRPNDGPMEAQSGTLSNERKTLPSNARQGHAEGSISVQTFIVFMPVSAFGPGLEYAVVDYWGGTGRLLVDIVHFLVVASRTT
jgi:hypothetical protein